MNKLYVSLLLSASLCASDQGGHLPNGFKFEVSKDGQRNSIIHQLARYEECNGDQACIQALQDMQNAVLIVINGNQVEVKNNSDAQVFVDIKESK